MFSFENFIERLKNSIRNLYTQQTPETAPLESQEKSVNEIVEEE